MMIEVLIPFIGTSQQNSAEMFADENMYSMYNMYNMYNMYSM